MPGFWGNFAVRATGSYLAAAVPPLGAAMAEGSGIAAANILLVALLQVTVGILQKPSQYALLGGFYLPKMIPLQN
jgi:hypothetical protein